MNGPYETFAAAAAAARAIESGPLASWPQARHRGLCEALTAAGVELGAYDHRIVDWLCGQDGPTVAVILGWVARADHHG